MLRHMLIAAVQEGNSIRVSCDGEIDYSGASVRRAMDAIDAVDEAQVNIIGHRGDYSFSVGSAFIVNGLPEDERITDAGGWVITWLDENDDF